MNVIQAIELPQHVHDLIARLASANAAPSQVWLIGSRANGRARPGSDTDLLVFGSQALIDELQILPAPIDIDCLVIYDGDNYQDPWQSKTGSLSKLKWQPGNGQVTQYIGGKFIPDDESESNAGMQLGDFVEYKEQAVLIWRAA